MKKVKWGVLGTAGIARNETIPGMKLAENCELTAIASRNLEKAEAFRTEFGFERAYGSYGELLEDKDVQAIYIPLPNHLHMEWTIRALEAGKNVLCEKPLAPTAADVRKMFAAARSNGMLLMEAFAYLQSPFTASVREQVQSGALGQILYMQSTFITSARSAADFRTRKDEFGGSLYDLGCYNTSQILWMLNEEPEDVEACASFSPGGVDLLTNSVLAFPSGARASLTAGMVLRTDVEERIDSFQIWGTKGSLRSHAPFNGAGMLTYELTAQGATRRVQVEARQNYALEVEQFGRCITDGEKPLVSEAFSVRNAQVMDRILKKIGY